MSTAQPPPARRPAPATVPTCALRIRGLRFRYGDEGPWTVDIAECTLAPGEQALLTGSSGSGKSTLLQLVAGLLDPRQGSVEIAGEEIHALRGAQRDLFRGRHVGMIFQTFQLLPGFTAIENVMLALLAAQHPRREHRPRAKALLDDLGIERHDAPVEQLSVGQQQRVAVARAVACRPTLVLADEPTASLDPENAIGAMDLIQETCRERGAALLCTSHDPAMRDRFERVMPIAAGRTAT